MVDFELEVKDVPDKFDMPSNLHRVMHMSVLIFKRPVKS